MEEKNHVGIAYTRCPVCDKETEDSILLDTRLKPTLNKHNVLGLKLCDNHFKEGYVAIIEVDSSKSKILKDGSLDPECIYRTDVLCHVRKEAADKIFNIKIDTFIFADISEVNKLRQLNGE